MKPTIRDAARDDLEAIRRIYNAELASSITSFDEKPRSVEAQEAWFDRLKPRYPVLVIDTNEDVVGWASLGSWSHHGGYACTAEISIFLDENVRGRGYGRLLLDALIEAGVNRDIRVFIARVVAGNEPSIRLHERLGFEQVGVQKEVGFKHGRWLDVVLMQRNLHNNEPPPSS